MIAVKKVENQNINWKNALAGGSSAAITRFLCQPLDVLKIRFQVQIEPLRRYQNSKYQSIHQAIRVIYREEGLFAFWKGHNPAQILSIIYGLTQFTVYERLNVSLSQTEWFQRHVLLKNFLCGGTAGAVATVLTTPLDVIRTRLIVQDNSRGYSNSFQAVKLIVSNEGFKGLYRGFGPAFIQITPLIGANFMFYKCFCSLLQNSLQLKSSNDMPAWGSFTMGAMSGVCSKTLVYPFDLLKKRLQIQGFEKNHQTYGKHFVCNSFVHSITATVKKEGFCGLYKGIMPSLLKAGLMTAIHFSCYENIKKLLYAK